MRKLILLLALMIFFPGVSNAMDTKIYGDIEITAFQRMFTRFERDSIDRIANYFDTTIWDTIYSPIYGEDSLGVLSTQEWLPSGHIGFLIQTDQFIGCIEFGVGKNTYDSKLSGSVTTRVLYNKYHTYFTVRKWYAQWLINDYLTFTAGRDYPPTNFLNSNKVIGPEIGYGNFGVFYTGSRPMFQLGLSLLDNMMEFKIAALKVDTVNIQLRDQYGGDVTNEIKAPKVEGSLQFNFDREEQLFGLRTKVTGGYQSYSTFKEPQDQHMDWEKREDWTIDINSYVAGADIGIRLWRFTLTVSGFIGQNLGPYGIVAGEPGAWRYENEFQYLNMYYPIHAIDTAIDTTGARGNYHTLYNSSQKEMSVILGIKITDFLYLEGGYQDIAGEHELETHFLSYQSGETNGINTKWEDDYNFGWYAQTTVTLFEYMNITLEGGLNKFGRYKGFGKYYYGALRVGLHF